jgi:CRP-like cAMP-binding protein
MASNRPRFSQMLSMLPPRDREELQQDLEPVRLDAERTLGHAHGPVQRVYFPQSGLVALSVTMADGRTAGVTIVGPEGVVGLAASVNELGGMDATVLVPGVAGAMSPERFRRALRRSEAVGRLIDRYAVAMLAHLAQTVACNRLHGLDQRAARWLLLAHERIGGDTFPLTQEAFANLLGVSRPAVSTVGARFARMRAAEFRRGTVHILDVGRLGAASCECLIADREALEPWLERAAAAARNERAAAQRGRFGVIRPQIRRAR